MATIASAFLASEVNAETFEWSGEVAAGMWSSDRMLNDRGVVVVARGDLAFQWQPSDNVRVVVDAWGVSAPERLDGRREDAGVREMYIKADALPCAPALGKQLVLWGRADGINPTDQLSPTNFRRLAPEHEDQRSGLWGLHLDCSVGSGRLQAHLIDHLQFNEIPLHGAQRTRFSEGRRSVRPTVALKYDVLGSAADWSVSAIEGYDLFPTLAIRSVSEAGVSLGSEATRMRLLGADVAIASGPVAYRAELAWVDFDQSTAPLVALRRPYLSAVGGVEWSFGEAKTLALQGFWKRLRSVPLPAIENPLHAQLQAAQGLISGEVDRTQYGLTLRYASTLLDSRAEMDVFAVFAQPRGDWAVRGRLNHRLTDSVRLSVGFDVFRGSPRSYLGNLRDNSLAFTEVGFAW